MSRWLSSRVAVPSGTLTLPHTTVAIAQASTGSTTA